MLVFSLFSRPKTPQLCSSNDSAFRSQASLIGAAWPVTSGHSWLERMQKWLDYNLLKSQEEFSRYKPMVCCAMCGLTDIVGLVPYSGSYLGCFLVF